MELAGEHMNFTNCLAAAVVGLALSSGQGAAQDADAGKKVFRKCSSCHQVGEKARVRVGPPLNGILGAAAASVEGFRYSDVLIESGLTWTEENLASYLADPKGFLPGNKMTFAGLKKEEDIANVIAYLAGFNAEGGAANN